jgi:hypothetical protein
MAAKKNPKTIQLIIELLIRYGADIINLFKKKKKQ